MLPRLPNALQYTKIDFLDSSVKSKRKNSFLSLKIEEFMTSPTISES